MSPNDPRHGTHGGYQQHRADREPACRPCLRGNRRYHKALMLDYHRGITRKVPAIGARRRIQALQRLGWSLRKISAHSDAWNGSTTVLIDILRPDNDTILRTTHAAVVDVYDRLSMRLPAPGSGATRARVAAEAKGYLPPLAWDDELIDDDDHTPPASVTVERVRRRKESVPRKTSMVDEEVVGRVLSGENLPTTRAEKQQIVTRWVRNGGSEAEICRRFGWKAGRYKLREEAAA